MPGCKMICLVICWYVSVFFDLSVNCLCSARLVGGGMCRFRRGARQ